MQKETPNYDYFVKIYLEEKERKHMVEYAEKIRTQLRADSRFQRVKSLDSEEKARLSEKILVHEQMRMGKPVLKGTRLTVSEILCAYVDKQKHPCLDVEENLLACFLYYVNHPQIRFCH